MLSRGAMERMNVDQVVGWLGVNGFDEAQRDTKKNKMNGMQLLALARGKVPKDIFGLGKSKTEKLIKKLKEIDNQIEYDSDDSFDEFNDEEYYLNDKGLGRSMSYTSADASRTFDDGYDDSVPKSPLGPNSRPPSLPPRSHPAFRARPIEQPKFSAIEASLHDSDASESYEYPDSIVEVMQPMPPPMMAPPPVPPAVQPLEPESYAGGFDSDYEPVQESTVKELSIRSKISQQREANTKPIEKLNPRALLKSVTMPPVPPSMPEIQNTSDGLEYEMQQLPPPLPKRPTTASARAKTKTNIVKEDPPAFALINEEIKERPVVNFQATTEVEFDSVEKAKSPPKIPLPGLTGCFHISLDEVSQKKNALKPVGQELRNKASFQSSGKSPENPTSSQSPLPVPLGKSPNQLKKVAEVPLWKAARKPAVEDKQALLPQKMPTKNPSSLEDQRWYKNITREEATLKLKAVKKDGAFIVRPSTKEVTKPHTLSVYVNGAIKNFPIRKLESGKFALGLVEKPNEDRFESICQMVEAFSAKMIIVDSSQGVTLIHTDW